MHHIQYNTYIMILYNKWGGAYNVSMTTSYYYGRIKRAHFLMIK